MRDFRSALPDATIYVYDNNSKDQTMARARAAGAIVRSETRQGKGNVVRRMFADIEADVYVLVDGDDTYDAAAAPALVAKLIDDGYDIVSGRRVATGRGRLSPRPCARQQDADRTDGADVRCRNSSDLLTGYRVMSRRFVKSFPFTAEGFGIETELTVHAVRLLMPMVEVDTRYKERPVGSVSKLNTWRDGFRILFTIVEPGARGAAADLLHRVSSRCWPEFRSSWAFRSSPSFCDTGLVPRLPTAVLATGLMLLAFLSLASGLILDTVTRGRWELKRLAYLAIPGPQDRERP